MAFTLTDKEKTFLLQLARNTIRLFLDGKEPLRPEPFSETLATPSGAFVTLHKQGELRGCIGYVKPFKPLQEAIVDLAVSAAFNDPRFPALTADEFAQIDLEISVLTPLEPVHDVSEIQIGRDGLLIKQGFYEGLLLPQVATEYGWDVPTFLEQTCRKAGLPAQAWKEADTEIQRFSAIIFDESQFSETRQHESDS
jgi:AmmeMemoRadiSam system protein A